MAECVVARFGGVHLLEILSNPEKAPRADPHAGYGGRGREAPGYPIRAAQRRGQAFDVGNSGIRAAQRRECHASAANFASSASNNLSGYCAR